MPMPKSLKVMLTILSIIIISLVGYGVKTFTDKQGLRDRQIEYLKNHEEEMTKFIESQDERITNVSYDWNSVDVGSVGGSATKEEAIDIEGEFNNNSDSSFSITMKLDEKHMPIMKSMFLGNPLSIGGDLL